MSTNDSDLIGADWANRCPECGYTEDRSTGPGTRPGVNRCPECRWPMNVIDRNYVRGRQ